MMTAKHQEEASYLGISGMLNVGRRRSTIIIYQLTHWRKSSMWVYVGAITLNFYVSGENRKLDQGTNSHTRPLSINLQN